MYRQKNKYSDSISSIDCLKVKYNINNSKSKVKHIYSKDKQNNKLFLKSTNKFLEFNKIINCNATKNVNIYSNYLGNLQNYEKNNNFYNKYKSKDRYKTNSISLKKNEQIQNNFSSNYSENYFSFTTLKNNKNSKNSKVLTLNNYNNRYFYNLLIHVNFINKNKHFSKIQLPKKYYRLAKYNDENVFLVDVDETLLTCERFNSYTKYDHIIHFNDNTKLGLSLRPYIFEFLKKLTTLGRVVIFSAGTKEYISHVKSIISKKILISDYLSREYCTLLNGFYIKDWRIFINVNQKNIILLDNSLYSFVFQLENGFPVFPYERNRNDVELLNFIKILNLENLGVKGDLKKFIKKYINIFDILNLKNFSNLTTYISKTK